jgi:RNA polymerase sigma-70 factor (ECF subfamily)
LSTAKTKPKEVQVFAVRSDIERAIASLSLADQRKLEKAARYRVKGAGRAAQGRDHKVLLHDAILCILEGAESADHGRHWPKNTVPFGVFVGGILRSIASHWRDEWNENEEILESDLLVETATGELLSPLDLAISGESSQERSVIAKEQLNAVLKLFAGDAEAETIIEAWALGMTGPEITAQFGISESRFDAARKRIRYQVKAE